MKNNQALLEPRARDRRKNPPEGLRRLVLRSILGIALLAPVPSTSATDAADLTAKDLELPWEPEIGAEWFVDREATLHSFAKIASYDLDSAMEVAALPSTLERWKRESAGAFPSPLLQKVFFDNPVFLVTGKGGDRWAGGIYHPWTDSWLMLAFEWQNDTRADRITDFAWISGGDPEPLPGDLSAEEILQRLQSRLENAVDTGRQGAIRLLENQGSGDDFSEPAPTDELQRYVQRLRSVLVPETGAAPPALGIGLEGFYERLEDGSQEWASEIRERIASPSLSLTPVFVSNRENGATIVLSASPDPYLMVFAEFDKPKLGELVLKGVEIHSLSIPGRRKE